MKVETQSAGGCKINLIVNVDSKETEVEYKKVLKMFNNEGRISGFRKGMAPIEIIKKNFQVEINKETESRLCRTFYKPAITEAGIKVVNLLNVKDVIFSPETGIVFTVVVDVEPEFSLPKYKKIAAKVQDAVVTEEDVDNYVDRMRSAFATFKEAPEDYEIQEHDLICMDYAGTVNDKPVKDLDPAAEQISGQDGFWVPADEAQFVPEVIKAVIGLKAGVEKTIRFKFAKTIPIEALRGQKAVYEVKITSVRQRITPTDTELCEQLKVETLDQFRVDARTKLLATAEQTELVRCKQVVTEHLLKKASFDVPESEMGEALNSILDQMMREAQYRGVKAEELAGQRDEIIKNATVSATNQVRMKYIVKEIAGKEEITASEDEVDAKIEVMAKEYNMEVDEIRKKITENDNLDVLEDQVIFDKTIDFIMAEAK